MCPARSTGDGAGLARHEGWTLLAAAEAVLKGVFEADDPVEIVAAPAAGPFAAIHELARRGEVARLLGLHGTELVATPDAARAVTLAGQRAAAGLQAIAMVPNHQLDSALRPIARACAEARSGTGALSVILEDDPPACPLSWPRRAAQTLGLATLEPADVEGLRQAMGGAVRLGRAGHGPVAIVAHRSILRSAATLEARPNRVLDAMAAAIVRSRRRGPRVEGGDLLRVARRLELNRVASAPSPGERVPVGFVVVGPAADALEHVVHVLRLHGRVPVLHLGLIHPLDASVVERLLSRCHRVVVLEPRPGSVEPGVLAVAETMRRTGVEPAVIGADEPLGPDEATHPSILARKIVGLLYAIRPGIELPLAADPPDLSPPPAARGDRLGAAGATAFVRGLVADADQWLRDRAPEDDEPGRGEPAALALDGAVGAGAAGRRIVCVETWSDERFLAEGVAALDQAAAGERPWTFVVCAVGAAGPSRLERLARAALPPERAGDLRVETADLNDLDGLREVLRSTLPSAQLAVVIVTDGPPARFDVDALERARAEVDRLGYEPRERRVRAAEEVCEIRPRAWADRPGPVLDAPAAPPLRTRFSAGRSPRRLGGRLRVRVRAMYEELEVVRDRPPASTWSPQAKRALPQPIHAARSQWRAHLAGFRGEAPGVAARVLCEAGRAMGYQVRSIHDPQPIGAGRRAWAQILFTRPRRDHATPIAATVPYGEADLLLGLDRRETLRAIDPRDHLRVANRDRTCCAANVGPFADEDDAGPGEPAAAAAALGEVTIDGPGLIDDVAAACRAAFHTDRVTDLAVLGAAFQLGFIPATLDAVETALDRIEHLGFGRAREAFRFGAHLASPAEGPSGPHPPAAGPDDAELLARRTVLLESRGRWRGGRTEAGRLGDLMRRTLARMPGLTETDPGRQARRDLVVALAQCHAWGRYDYARRYADLVTALYRVDRGDKGRAITRAAILPLAHAMLIRDGIFVATMATSPLERVRARRRLNVKHARGDLLHRRYLTRFEVVALERRLRLDVRSSDWPAWAAAVAGRRIPRRLRGSARERRLRELVIDLVERAADGAVQDYDRWAERIQRLHHQAAEDRLRTMALSELRMLIGGRTS